VILLLASTIVLIISSQSLNKSRLGCFEFFTLYSICVFGTLIFVSSIDLFCLFLALEVQSISFYALVALNRNSEYCAEAGIKYFILGAFTAGIFLFGISLIYSSTGTTSLPDLFHILRGLSSDLVLGNNDNFEYFVSDNFRLLLGLIFILVGFLFKVTAVPFHMWAPDIYEGAPFITVVFISTIPKIAVFFILMKLSAIYLTSLGFIWKYIFISSGLLSIIIGTLFALRQFKVRRFLAYSSITHMGFILLSLSTGTFEGIKFAFSYVLIYIISLLNMWAIISMLEHSYNCRIDSLLDLGGIFYKNKLLGANFIINLFSLAGLPPFVGFYAKLYVLTTLISSAYYSITLICVLASLFSIYYYIKVVKVILFDSKTKILSKFTRTSYLQSFVINFLLILLVIFFYIPGVHSFLESFTQQIFLF
jgi:NADH-quinone oxidoreductase subunit N